MSEMHFISEESPACKTLIFKCKARVVVVSKVTPFCLG